VGTALNLSDYAELRREADRAAAGLVRRFHLPAADRDDLRHDLLVDLFVRLKDFDPSRGTLAAFAVIVIRHGVPRLAARLRRDSALFAPLSLDDPISGLNSATLGGTVAEDDDYTARFWPPTNPIDALEHRLSLDRALNTLSPKWLGLCVDLIASSVGRLCTEREPSRATFYRQLKDVRLCLMAAGLGPQG
jgi:DNA-directed RNA polymerase specialized sigma24 family protein